LSATHALEFPLLKNSQQGNLRLCRKVAYFIEEDRPAIGRFETAEAALSGPREGAFSCPNSSDAIREGGFAAQFTRMKARFERLDRL
jgi:hypothetical protein